MPCTHHLVVVREHFSLFQTNRYGAIIRNGELEAVEIVARIEPSHCGARAVWHIESVAELVALAATHLLRLSVLAKVHDWLFETLLGSLCIECSEVRFRWVLLPECKVCIGIASTVVGVNRHFVFASRQTVECLIERDARTVVAHGVLLVAVHRTGGPSLDDACALVTLGRVEGWIHNHRRVIGHSRLVLIAVVVEMPCTHHFVVVREHFGLFQTNRHVAILRNGEFQFVEIVARIEPSHRGTRAVWHIETVAELVALAATHLLRLSVFAKVHDWLLETVG